HVHDEPRRERIRSPVEKTAVLALRHLIEAFLALGIKDDDAEVSHASLVTRAGKPVPAMGVGVAGHHAKIGDTRLPQGVRLLARPDLAAVERQPVRALATAVEVAGIDEERVLPRWRSVRLRVQGWRRTLAGAGPVRDRDETCKEERWEHMATELA